MPWDPLITGLSDILLRLYRCFKKPKYPEGVMVMVWTPETWWGKALAWAIGLPQRFQRRVRHLLVTLLYEELPPLYVKTLIKPDLRDISLYWEKLKICVEADRAQYEVWRQKVSHLPEFEDMPAEDAQTLEEDVHEMWSRLLESCYDSYFFALRSRVQRHYWLLTLPANTDYGGGNMSYADTFVDEAEAKASLGPDAALVTISDYGLPNWTAGTTLLDLHTGREWRVTDGEGNSVNISENAPAPTVEVEDGSGQPYPVLVLPIRLEPL